MLEALGYSVETVDLPCTSKVPGTTQSDDAAQVRSSVESLLSKGKSVIVWHTLTEDPSPALE